MHLQLNIFVDLNVIKLELKLFSRPWIERETTKMVANQKKKKYTNRHSNSGKIDSAFNMRNPSIKKIG